MLLDLGKAVALIASMTSLYWVMLGAFFEPGTHWQDRLELCLARVAIAAAICIAGGVLFRHARPRGSAATHLLFTLPVQVFFYGFAAMTTLFVVSWYLEEYYLPWLRR